MLLISQLYSRLLCVAGVKTTSRIHSKIFKSLIITSVVKGRIFFNIDLEGFNFVINVEKNAN
jgi:hypothetical protein